MPQSWLPGFGVRVAVVLMLAVQHNALVGRCISYTKCKDSPGSGPTMSWQKHSHDDTDREFGGKERGLTRRREARVLAAIRQALGGPKIQILAQEGISPMRPS